MSVPIPINAQQTGFFDTTNRAVPCEGPRCIPLRLDFTKGDTYEIDLQNIIDLKRISLVQGVYLDNYNGTAALTVTCQQTGQMVSMPAGCQGYRSLLAPNPAALFFISQNQVTNTVFLLNFPVIDSTWSGV